MISVHMTNKAPADVFILIRC